MESDAAPGSARTGSAAERLAQVRGRTLDLLVGVALAARLLTVALYGPGAWRARSYSFLVVTAFELLTYAVLIAFRSLPLRARAWSFCLIWLVVFAFYIPRGVYAVPLVNAVASAFYATLLLGPWAGVVFILAVLGLLAAAGFLPPEVLSALSFGPVHPPRPDPPLIVAPGLIPLLAAPAGITIVLRGLVRGFAEARLNEERFRGIVEASPEAMAVVDWSTRRFCDVNRAFEQLFGWQRAEVLGRGPLEVGLLRESDVRLLDARLGAESRISGVELVMRRRDGAPLFTEAGLHRTEIGGNPVILVVVREVTAQRRLEAAVRQAQRVEAMGTLTGGIAHNFRNALGSILPNLDYCLEQAPGPLREALEDARSAASAAVDLATRLTQMAQRGSGGDHGPVELRSVVASVVGICRSTFGSRVAIHESLDVPGAVLADRGALHQVFLNLLLNARDALDGNAAGRIEVGLARSSDGSRLVATVADNGCGMDEDTLRRIGEPFFTTKPEGKGTGLGLSTAFAAVRDAGGRLSARSQPGVGTTFTLELPLCSGEAAASKQASPRPVRSHVRVLVVDDDPLLLEAVSRQLVSLGLEADPVVDPVTALERVRSAPGAYDILLTDLDMPVLSGSELAARVHEVAPSLPVLVLSGSEHEEAVVGAVAVLAKPAMTATLAEAVGRCLGLGAVHAA